MDFTAVVQNGSKGRSFQPFQGQKGKREHRFGAGIAGFRQTPASDAQKQRFSDTVLVSSLMHLSLIFPVQCPPELVRVLTLLGWGQGRDVVS